MERYEGYEDLAREDGYSKRASYLDTSIPDLLVPSSNTLHTLPFQVRVSGRVHEDLSREDG
jgi:hypothetical protein